MDISQAHLKMVFVGMLSVLAENPLWGFFTLCANMALVTDVKPEILAGNLNDRVDSLCLNAAHPAQQIPLTLMAYFR